jgi:polar amino acid transport system substrate-binding protein
MPPVLLRAIAASLAALTLLVFAITGECRAEESSPLTVFVFDRPPYYQLDQGKPAGGFLLDIALAILDRAGLPYKVQELPPSRILATFQAKTVPACAVGWLRTPQREALAWFSPPIYRNKALGAAVNANARPYPQTTTLDALLRTGLIWGLREGFSYGSTIDEAFAAYPASKLHRFSNPQHMLHLLARQRLEAVLIEPEELAWLLRQEPNLAESIRLLPLADAPASVTRHIMCSAAVAPAVLDRINAAIEAYVGTEAYRRQSDFASRR